MADIKISELETAVNLGRNALVEVSVYDDQEDEYASNNASVGQLVAGGYIDLTNVSIASNAWSLQSTPDFSGYPYVATISASGVTSADIAEVIPSLSAINSGKLCPLNKTVTDGVQIYASEALSSSIVIEHVSIRGTVS